MSRNPAARPATSADLRFRRRDSTELWGLVSASPIVGRDGVTLVGSVGMVADITERKRAEESSALRRPARHVAAWIRRSSSARSPAEVGRAALGRGPRRTVPCQRCSRSYCSIRSGRSQSCRVRRGGPLSASPLPLGTFQPRRSAASGVAALRARTSPPWTIRRRFFPALMAEGLGGPLFGAAPGGRRGDRRDQPRLLDARGVRRRSTGRSPSRSRPPLAIAIQHARLREELARRTAELERRVGGARGGPAGRHRRPRVPALQRLARPARPDPPHRRIRPAAAGRRRPDARPRGPALRPRGSARARPGSPRWWTTWCTTAG